MLSWKVYDAGGVKRGATLDSEDAAVLVSLFGVGATVRYVRRVVWREGPRSAGGDGEAGESYDAAADVMRARAGAHVRRGAWAVGAT